jgi:hypothetical protein
VRSPHVQDATTFGLEAGIILGPVLALLLSVLFGWSGHVAAAALIVGLDIGLLGGAAFGSWLGHRHDAEHHPPVAPSH